MIREKTSTINIYLHLILAIGAFILYGYTNAVLDQSYAASKFPVPYFEGQTAFSGELIKEYYAFMIEVGTLDIYWRTQFIDFAFIGSVILTGLFLPSFVARLHRDGSWLRAITFGFALLMPLGGIFDAIENLISFVMLARPETFPNWIALVYSSFAIFKFSSMIPAMIGTAISLIFVLVIYIGSKGMSLFRS